MSNASSELFGWWRAVPDRKASEHCPQEIERFAPAGVHELGGELGAAETPPEEESGNWLWNAIVRSHKSAMGVFDQEKKTYVRIQGPLAYETVPPSLEDLDPAVRERPPSGTVLRLIVEGEPVRVPTGQWGFELRMVSGKKLLVFHNGSTRSATYLTPGAEAKLYTGGEEDYYELRAHGKQPAEVRVTYR